MQKTKNYFEQVDPKVNFPKMEESVLGFWEKEKVFEKSLDKNKDKKNFVFYEGPPTANGRPGIHHVESRSFKDMILRYKTMQGFNVPRRAGWDCHGLPVELQVEKALHISGKPQIEKYGIEAFNELCRKSVYEYIDDWTKVTKRIGYWLDTNDSYETMDNNFIESEWFILKQTYEKGLLYEDYKVVPYCARCGTSLSSHELAQGYKDDVEDLSVFVKFKIKESFKNNIREKLKLVGKHLLPEFSSLDFYLLAWTTTPWTLPGNVALAVDKDEDYALYLDKELSQIVIGAVKTITISGWSKAGFEKVAHIKGSDLINIEYEPLFNFVSYDTKSHFVISADFVSMNEGTGVVHTAVMYGEDDFKLGELHNLPKKHVVNERGEFTEEITPWAGKFVKSVDKEIIEALDKNGNLFKVETTKHTYPFCWRCGTPLLYYAMTSWYLKTTAVKKDLLKNNNSVNWMPDHIKEGRMGDWLKNNHDWALSRSRYWGTPLPIWRCKDCKETLVVGSVEELSTLAEKDLSKLDLHRPFIDEITIKCKKCEGLMLRVSFVLDCWFDSGAMPYAQWHYPFENKDKFKDNFPADYISEAIDQTRGWFYTLQGVSALLENGTAYKNVICLGHVLDEKGNKMSKSKGNIIDPWEVVNEVGADATRWYFYSVIAPGPSFKFSTNLVKDVTKRFLLILWNIYNYFVSYANVNDWKPDQKTKSKTPNVVDKWILAKLQDLVNKTTNSLDKYDLYNATHLIEDFVVKDFSQWYIRRSRGREEYVFFETAQKVLVTVCKLIAPFAPFVSEVIYKNLTKEESVHLAGWPTAKKLDQKEIDLINEMHVARNIVELAHSARKEKQIPVRMPLQTLYIHNQKFSEEVERVIMEEVNVKAIAYKKNLDKVMVELDTTITPELQEESDTRDLIRKIQVARKELGVEINEKVNLTTNWLPGDKALKDWIIKRTLINKVTEGEFGVSLVDEI